jgi:hypothetical protein
MIAGAPIVMVVAVMVVAEAIKIKHATYKMKTPILILVLAGALGLMAMRTSHRRARPNICNALKSLRQLPNSKFNPEDHERINLKELRKIDSVSAAMLLPYPGGGDGVYLYGKFRITANRVGIVCFNRTHECDELVYSFTLHIVDSCSTAKEEIVYLSYADGHDPVGWQVSSSLNKTMDTLTVKEENTSEWVEGDPRMKDTLFTTIYKLNLKSKNLDTVWKKRSYKILK